MTWETFQLAPGAAAFVVVVEHVNGAPGSVRTPGRVLAVVVAGVNA